jgi:hypothetical protein
MQTRPESQPGVSSKPPDKDLIEFSGIQILIQPASTMCQVTLPDQNSCKPWAYAACCDEASPLLPDKLWHFGIE